MAGQSRILGGGEMLCGCHANESDLAECGSHVRLLGLLHSPFSRSPRSPSEAIPAGNAELEPCGGCRSSTGSDPSYWPHL